MHWEWGNIQPPKINHDGMKGTVDAGQEKATASTLSAWKGKLGHHDYGHNDQSEQANKMQMETPSALGFR